MFKNKAYGKQSRGFALIGFTPRHRELGLCPSEGITPAVQGPSAEQSEIRTAATTRFRRERRGPDRKARLSEGDGGLVAS